jgi:hypothetical protein
VDDAGPDKEGRDGVEGLLELALDGALRARGRKEGVPDDNEDEQAEGEDVEVRPVGDLVSAETRRHLLEVLGDEVEGAEEEDEFEHDIVEGEHA